MGYASEGGIFLLPEFYLWELLAPRMTNATTAIMIIMNIMFSKVLEPCIEPKKSKLYRYVQKPVT